MTYNCYNWQNITTVCPECSKEENKMSNFKWVPGKEYFTTGGKRAKIYATELPGNYTIHGAWFDQKEEWSTATWTSGGQYNVQAVRHTLDLTEREWEEPKPKVRWLAWGIDCGNQINEIRLFPDDEEFKEGCKWIRVPHMDPPEGWEPG